MSKPVFVARWNVEELAAAMRIPAESVIAFYTDGRRAAFLLESAARSHLVAYPSASEADAYDLVDRTGRRWEVRGLTKNGVFFDPSSSHGTGRSYSEDAFLAKLKAIAGFYVADLTLFPSVPFYQISSAVVRGWFKDGKLSKARLSTVRAKALIATL